MTELELPWRDVFAHSPVAMSVVDPFGRQLAGNRAYAEMFGYTEAELAALDVGRLTLDEDRVWTASYLTRLVSGDIDRFVTEKRYRHRDGSTLHARLTATPLRDGDGDCYGVLGIIEPIQELPRVDDARLRRFLEFSESMFILLDGKGGVIEASGRYRSVLGYPPEFWETRTIFELLDPSDLDKAIAFRAWLHAHPGETATEEMLVRAADGQIHTVRVTGVNLLDDPDVRGIVVTTNNITEHRQQVAELEERSDTAEAVAKAQLQLLATVSHELRNPLHVVQGLAELLASEPLPEPVADLARRLHRQVSGLADVTQDLLDAGGLAAGSVRLNLAAVDLYELVGEIVDYGRVAVDERGIAVEAFIDVEVPQWVEGDGFRMRQILRNLVGNAVKFTAVGKVGVSVRLGPDDTLVLAVADTGVGIPAAELARVLEPFGTASTAGTGRGAGLGLSIVHHLAGALGGRLSVRSEPGVGSTFTVELPLVPVAAPVAVDTGDRVDGPSGLTVLIVEDNPVNQQLAVSQLERLGMSAIVIDSGEAAVEWLSQPDHPVVDVVLMDYFLPGIDGLETTKRIRRIPDDTAFVPVIGLTASASVQHRETFRAAGLDGFLAKPASVDDLRRAISEVLGLTRLGRVATVLPEPVPAPAPAAPAATAEPCTTVDGKVLEQLANEFDSRATVSDLIDSFLRELHSRVEAIGSAIAEGDDTTAARAAHTLKSGARLLGAGELADLCLEIERGDTAGADRLDALADAARAELLAWTGGAR